jgi:hypothetical protein
LALALFCNQLLLLLVDLRSAEDLKKSDLYQLDDGDVFLCHAF